MRGKSERKGEEEKESGGLGEGNGKKGEGRGERGEGVPTNRVRPIY